MTPICEAGGKATLQTKTCIKCGHTKPITEFSSRPDNRANYYNTCRLCVNAAENGRQIIKQQQRKSLAEHQRQLLGAYVCGYCGRRLYPKKGRGMMLLCRDHRPRMTSHNNDFCAACPLRQLCSERVNMRMWAYCERPDRRDLWRLASYLANMPPLTASQAYHVNAAIKMARAEKEWEQLTGFMDGV